MELIKTEIGIDDTDRIEAVFDPGKKYGTLKFQDNFYKTFEIEMHRERAERLVQAIERELYEEIPKDTVRRLECKIARLELELEETKDKIEYMEGL